MIGLNGELVIKLGKVTSSPNLVRDGSLEPVFFGHKTGKSYHCALSALKDHCVNAPEKVHLDIELAQHKDVLSTLGQRLLAATFNGRKLCKRTCW